MRNRFVNRKVTTLVTACFLAVTISHAGVDEGIAAIQRNDYNVAYREFSALAAEGDSKAMTTIGMFFYNGDGFAQDYGKAMHWFIKAFQLGNGDAFNNIGVMYRDGLGVDVNRSIAYDLFLITHMRSLGSESTQYRANRNLRREVVQLTNDQIQAALCLSEEEVAVFVLNKGNVLGSSNSNSKNYVALKDKDWWLEGEIEDFDCP